VTSVRVGRTEVTQSSAPTSLGKVRQTGRDFPNERDRKPFRRDHDRRITTAANVPNADRRGSRPSGHRCEYVVAKARASAGGHGQSPPGGEIARILRIGAARFSIQLWTGEGQADLRPDPASGGLRHGLEGLRGCPAIMALASKMMPSS
jgi:hypothetical protein